MEKSIRVFAPATVANVACGFDIMGFAIEQPGDEVVMRLTDKRGVVEIEKIIGDEGKLPLDADKNTVGLVVQQLLHDVNSKHGVSITLYKNMPLGSGLGSSAASAVAGLYAVNELLLRHEPGKAIKERKHLIPYAMEGERLASGSAHADNVAPALMGGFVLIRSYEPLDVITIPTPLSLWVTVIHPQVEIQTRDARSILRKQISLKDAIVQWGNTAGLVAGLWQCDYELIGRSMQDVIVEPIRSILIPGFDSVKQSAMKAGALGCGISGSGPSVFALSRDELTATEVGRKMQNAFGMLNIDSEVYVSPINRDGPRVIE
ncbi:homoserine kinase [Catalinimonas alkaloidigena]|uniref:homoserine kinase n=1 Tax=Catalinimonas alkaloidigena TaxID=1075417 RepID=UPI0024069C25|nr:homoserine kinase [Catalinimonas alkaloidigena]MDF9800293.1 homoserine kinase [Catalinimonas alkaloidigena]